MSPQEQHYTTQMILSHYTSSPSFCHNFNIITKHCYQSLSLGMECWCKRILMDSESIWCQTCMILYLLASRNRRNEFLLLTLQSVVLCNSNINHTKISPSQMISQSKNSLLKNLSWKPDLRTQERRPDWTEGLWPRAVYILYHWSPWKLQMGLHGATHIHSSRKSSHMRILDRK